MTEPEPCDSVTSTLRTMSARVCNRVFRRKLMHPGQRPGLSCAMCRPCSLRARPGCNICCSYHYASKSLYPCRTRWRDSWHRI